MNWDPSPTSRAHCHTPHFANATVAGWPLWNRFVDLTRPLPLLQCDDDTRRNSRRPALDPPLGCHDGTPGTAVVNGIWAATSTICHVPDRAACRTSRWPNRRRCHGEMYGDPPLSGGAQPRRRPPDRRPTRRGPGRGVQYANGCGAAVGPKPTAGGRVRLPPRPHDATITLFLRTNTGSALPDLSHEVERRRDPAAGPPGGVGSSRPSGDARARGDR
jgi:hypothetical protein